MHGRKKRCARNFLDSLKTLFYLSTIITTYVVRQIVQRTTKISKFCSVSSKQFFSLVFRFKSLTTDLNTLSPVRKKNPTISTSFVIFPWKMFSKWQHRATMRLAKTNPNMYLVQNKNICTSVLLWIVCPFSLHLFCCKQGCTWYPPHQT